MYGLEKSPKEKFLFELEKNIKQKPEHRNELLGKAEEHIQSIKALLRKGAEEKDFDRLGVLLHGYTALQKVLKKIAK